jgi:hypothetical protein
MLKNTPRLGAHSLGTIESDRELAPETKVTEFV